MYAVHGYSLYAGHPWCPTGSPPIPYVLLLWATGPRHRPATRRALFEQHRARCGRCNEAANGGVLYRYVSGVRRVFAEPAEARTVEMFWMGECRLTYDIYVRRFLPTPPGWARHWQSLAAEPAEPAEPAAA